MSGAYRLSARDIYDQMAGDLDSLKRHWEQVTGDSSSVGSRSGGWDVRKEHEADRLGPPFHEVVIYVEKGYKKREIARWPLDDLPDDPLPEVREAIGIRGDHNV